MSKIKPSTAKNSAKSTPFVENLSLVIPCYNESTRIDALLRELKQFDKEWNGAFEIIIVNDGSTDDTAEKINALFTSAFSQKVSFKLINLPKNQGKGAALQVGVAAASGEFILTLDADMATSPLELQHWLKRLPNHSFDKNTIYIGSREHEESQVDGNFIRRAAGLTYNFVTQLFTNLPHTDTQCGFKLYPTHLAKELFSSMKNKGWAHDIELLLQAQTQGIPIEPMPLAWKHQADSKISLLKDGLGMFFQTLGISTRLRWNWFVKKPVQDILQKNNASNPEPSYYRLLFVTLSVLLLFLMPMLSFDYGITGDEDVQKEYGEKVLAYYETDGKDNSCLTYKNLYFYGGLFDYVCAWANKHIGGLDPYDMRHFINALVGFLLMFFTGILAKDISRSWKIGFFALLFMAFSPRIFGDAMNNPKDIPFAAAYIFTLIYLVRFLQQLPRPSSKTLFLLTVGIAAAINMRVGGILLIAYLGMFALLGVVFEWKKFSSIAQIGRLGVKVGLVALLGYFGGLLFWPYGMQAPIANPMKALSEMSNFSTGIRVLFEGQHLWSDQLPWYYIPKWLFITSPIVVLIGLLLFVLFYIYKVKENKHLSLVALIFVTVFPVAYAIIKRSSLYDGFRHFLFVYPLLVVMAALGWHFIQNTLKAKTFQYAITACLGGLLILPAWSMLKNHPYQYVYFNEIFGGTAAAHGKYETDYWMVSMKRLSEWLAKNDERIKKGETVTVHTNCAAPVRHYFSKLAPNVKVGYVRYDDRAKSACDYWLFFSRFVDTNLLKNEAFPPSKTVHTETADGAILGAVIKRDSLFDYKASLAEKAGNQAEAIRLYQLELAQNPKNETALLGLANAYMNSKDLPNTEQTIQKLLALSDTHTNHLNAQGVFYINTNQADKALETYQRLEKLNYKYSLSYYYQALIYKSKNNLDEALRVALKILENGGNFKPGIELIGSLYQAKGDQVNAQKYLEYAKQLK